MADLIPIALFRIGSSEVESVDGRILHANLRLDSHYSHWIQFVIKRLNLVEDVDFMRKKVPSLHPQGGRPRKDYLLTTEAAEAIRALYQGTWKKSKSTYLYLVKQDKTPYVKIGITRNYHSRLIALQNGNPCRLYYLSIWDIGNTSKRVEKDLHAFFRTTRAIGEWFTFSKAKERQLFRLLMPYPRVLIPEKRQNVQTQQMTQLVLW